MDNKLIILGVAATAGIAYFMIKNRQNEAIASYEVAPTFQDYPFPDTSYLKGIEPKIWREVTELKANIRQPSTLKYSVKQLMFPPQVDDYSFYYDPIELAIIKMYKRTIEVPYDDSVFRNTNDNWKYPVETLNTGGNCIDTSNLLVSMILNRISDVYVVGGWFVGTTLIGHAWVVVRLAGKGEFIFETTLDSMPSKIWNEVHNDSIGQYYIPVGYWNVNNIFLEDTGYQDVMSGPVVTEKSIKGITPLFGMSEVEKRKQINDLWKKK